MSKSIEQIKQEMKAARRSALQPDKAAAKFAEPGHTPLTPYVALSEDPAYVDRQARAIMEAKNLDYTPAYRLFNEIERDLERETTHERAGEEAHRFNEVRFQPNRPDPVAVRMNELMNQGWDPIPAARQAGKEIWEAQNRE